MIRRMLGLMAALAMAGAAAAQDRPYVKAPLPAGYVEEEIFLTSDPAPGPGFSTVINLRRPMDVRRASGVVVVEPWHPGDLWPVQSTTQGYLARSGHAMAVVVASPFVVERLLKRANAERYGRLIVPEGAAAERAILDRAADALRTVPELKARKLILAGYSNTGAVLRSYIGDGKRPLGYDGYLVGQTAVGTKPEPIPDVDVPVIEIQGESELIRTFQRGGDGIGWRRPDGPNFRLYEVPGLAHLNSRDDGEGDPIRWRCVETVRSQYPHRQTWSAILALLVRWVDKGVPAPHAPQIETADGGRTVLRDAYGNAKGGVRSVVLDVPLAGIMPVGANAPADPPSARCDMVGWQKPLPRQTLARLYGDHAGYVRRVEARLAELVRDGWLLPQDAAALRAEARTAKVP